MFQYKDRFTGYGISIIKIKRPWGRLIFIMEILILGRRHHFIENALRQWSAQCPFLQMLEYLSVSWLHSTQRGCNMDVYSHVVLKYMRFLFTFSDFIQKTQHISTNSKIGKWHQNGKLHNFAGFGFEEIWIYVLVFCTILRHWNGKYEIRRGVVITR